MQAPVTVVLTGRRNYQGTDVTINNCYYIRKAPSGQILDLSTAKVVLKETGKDIPSQMYTGNPIKPEIELLFKNKKQYISGSKLGLKEGTDYKVFYFDNVKPGTAMVFVKALSFKGKTINSATTTFKIVPRE